MPTAIEIRAYTQADAAAVRDLFITVNRQLAPGHLQQAFEDYIALSLKEEIDRIDDYYGARQGGFWVALAGDILVGMFGLEPSSDDAMELRRMYVAPTARRLGIARTMLRFAEDECRRRHRLRMNLSTSELQGDALSLYRNSFYHLVREEIARGANNKTVGGGIRRFHFSKSLCVMRDPLPTDRTEWHRMWSTNCTHFSGAMSEADDRELWRRIIDPNHPVGALVCGTPDRDGTLFGFAHYVLHPHTFSPKMVCYLEDLWVDPAARGAGIGGILIDGLVARGREQDWRRVYWHTDADNVAARQLYDRISRITNYVRYDIDLT